MSRATPNPDRLFDRGFRPGHPFQPRLSRLRRWGMFLLFVLLVGVISSYGYLTDANRVRGMAESYLSNLLGGRVEVGGANLSIFEGLRLDDVRILVDSRGAADAEVFSAQTFLVRYD